MREVYCYDLKRDEIKELLALLQKLLFKYISVDTKSIKAVKEGHFRETYQAMKKLEKKVLVGQKNYESLLKIR